MVAVTAMKKWDSCGTAPLYSPGHSTNINRRVGYYGAMDGPQTTVNILTPTGRGAVATVTIQGPQAVDIVQQCFTAASGKRLSNLPLRRIIFGRWQGYDDAGEELVVCRLEDDRVEVHCHGGAAAVEAIVSSLESAGAIRQSAEDWGTATELDLIAAEARLALAEAKTERTALILLDQYHGALRREVETILDFFARGDDLTGQLKLARLAQLSKAGQHLTTPWRIAIVGLPNVGKSSLMNALVGYSRSIVYDRPGTTRDLVRAETAFDGWPVELIDTAGLRETVDAIEAVGVGRAEQVVASADLCLRVSDSVELPGDRAAAADVLPSRIPELAVLNKVDLVPAQDAQTWTGPKVSAKTGQGLPDLMRSIAQTLLDGVPLSNDAVPFTPRQIGLIEQARRVAKEIGAYQAITILRQMLVDGEPGSH